MSDAAPTPLIRPWMTRMLGLVGKLGGSRDLQETLQLITEGVVDVIDFRAAAMNVTLPGGDLRCEAVAGPGDLAEVLLHTVTPRTIWDDLLGRCERWGDLYFLPAEGWRPGIAVPSWTPEIKELDHPDAWRADDSLFVPMADHTGALLGILSVDDPVSGMRPDMEQRTMLELFAAEAANALSDALRRSELSDSEVVFRRVFADAPVPMLVTDAAMAVLHANEAFGHLAAIAPDQIGPSSLGSLLVADDADQLRSACATVAAGKTDALTVEHRLVRVDRMVRWVRTTASRIDTERAGPRLVLRLEDVTEDRKALEELRRLADHDALTGLPNRRIARRRLDHLLGEGMLDSRIVVVLYCDLDGFKGVNDQLGHAAGDELLTLVASRLSRVIRPPDLLCREGGDEFVVIATMGAADRPDVIAQRCIDALAAPFALRSGPAAVSLSVGIAVGDRPGLSAAELLRESDAALYRAKSAGRNRWSYATG